MRRKMAMKMKSSSSTRRCSSSFTTRFNRRTSLLNTATKIAVNNNNIYNFSTHGKEFRNADVGPLGRIILPKKPLVEHLPALGDDGKGIHIAVQDFDSPTTWHLRYRFWINNESKICILENTGSYVQHHDLKTRHHVTLCKDKSNLIYISYKKAEPFLNVEGPDAEQLSDMYPVAAEGDCNLTDLEKISDFDDFPC